MNHGPISKPINSITKITCITLNTWITGWQQAMGVIMSSETKPYTCSSYSLVVMVVKCEECNLTLFFANRGETYHVTPKGVLWFSEPQRNVSECNNWHWQKMLSLLNTAIKLWTKGMKQSSQLQQKRLIDWSIINSFNWPSSQKTI